MREDAYLPVGRKVTDCPAEFQEADAALRATTHEYSTLQRMRWFLLILLAISFLASTIIGIIAFLLTRNPYTLVVIPTPTLLIRPAANALLPLDTRRFYLAVLKLQFARSYSPKTRNPGTEEPSR